MRTPAAYTVAIAATLAVLAVSGSLAEGDSALSGGRLADQIRRSNAELESLRQEITAHRERIAGLTTEERDTARELEGLVKEMDLVRELLAGLDHRERILVRQSDSLQVRLARSADALQSRQSRLARRMRSLYVEGPRRHLELVLTADSFSSLVTRLKFTTLMARQDGRLMSRTRQEHDEVGQARQQLQATLAGLWEAREEARRERERLEQVDAERRAVLALLQRERGEAEQALSALRERQDNLANLLADLERQREATAPAADDQDGSFAALAGTLDWPVTGEVVTTFGRSVHPEFKTVTLNNGVTIAAYRGTPVFAVAAGQVEFADNLPGFGVCVILDHGAGYYSLYAHLDRVFVARGANVGRNEILAEVGKGEGNGESGLYFEIRRGKTPLDPSDWLRPRNR